MSFRTPHIPTASRADSDLAPDGADVAPPPSTGGSPLPPRGETLHGGAVWLLGWHGTRVVCQAVWFIVAARLLGPSSYGVLSTAAALAAMVGTFTGVGSSLVMLRAVARSPAAMASEWRRTLVASATTGVLLLVGFVVVSRPFFRELAGGRELALVALAEVLCFPLVIAASHAFQAHSSMVWAGLMYALVPVSNLCAAVLFALGAGRSLLHYLQFHAWMSVLVAAAALMAVGVALRPGGATFSVTRQDLRTGLGFTVMRFADGGMLALDKALALQLAGPPIVGVYAPAMRLATLAALPLTSIATAALPRLYRLNDSDPVARWRQQLRLLLLAGGLGALATLGMWGIAPLAPWLLGEAYDRASEAVRLVAVVPVLYGLASVGGSIALGRDRLRLRVVALLSGLAAMALLGAVLVRSGELLGVALAATGGHATVVAVLAWGLRHDLVLRSPADRRDGQR